MSLIIVVILFASLIFLYGGPSSNERPSSKGERGEDLVVSSLEKLVRRGYNGKILRNLYIDTGNGYTTEIDVLFLTKKGIFVIESKNYIGWIFGNERNKNWTVSLYSGKDLLGFKHTEKHQFYNPIKQNQGHIRHLKQYIKSNVDMYSYIVFSDRCEFKDVTYDKDKCIVCYMSNFMSRIENRLENLPDKLTDKGMERLYARLLVLENASDEVKSKHKAQVKETKQH